MEDNENINKEKPDVSWIFVEKRAVLNESEPNGTTTTTTTSTATTEEYVFKSGVQELTDDDLGSTSCDSDGISVISETECFLHDDCTCLPKNTSEDDDEYNTIEEDQTCSNKENNVNIEVIHEPVTTMTQLIESSEPDKQVTTTTNNNNNNSNVLTFASTVAGVCIVITYLISNYNTTIKNDVTIEDFDDDMYDMYLWTHYDDNETCDFNNDLIELNTDIISSFVKTYDTTKQQQSGDTNLPIATKPTENTKKNTIINQNVNKANKRDKQHISRNSNTINNNDDGGKKVKQKNKDNHKMETEHLKQHENYLKKKEKYLTKREKYLKKLEKHIVHLEARFRKLFNRMKKDAPQPQQQQQNTEYNRKKIKINGTGEWYEKMSYGRSEIRNKEKLSDWMFERSKMRNKLRDKAHWYFNRANGREEYRSSENIRSGKRNHFKTYRY